MNPFKKKLAGLLTKDTQFPLDAKIDIEIESKNWDESLCLLEDLYYPMSFLGTEQYELRKGMQVNNLVIEKID